MRAIGNLIWFLLGGVSMGIVWWEFRLDTVDWSLSLYLVVIIYATLLFFVSLVIQPVITDQISSYKDYYFSNRGWIFGLLIAIWLWDFVDTLSKGTNHFLNLGTEYLVFNITQIIASVVAIITTNERYHEIFAVVWIVYFVSFMYRTFFIIS